MSQKNVKIVRSANAALAEQGVEAALAFADTQFEATTPSWLASEPDTPGPRGGSRYFAAFGDAVEGSTSRAVDLRR